MCVCIRACDWTTTPLGPIELWSERLKLMVEQILASPLVSSLVCGPDRILIYNDAAARLFGDRPTMPLGQPLPKAFPEGWTTVADFYERAFAGESVVVTGQPLDTRGEGNAARDVFDAYLTPVHEADTVAYVHAISIEIGERTRAEANLRISEERFQHVVRATRDIVWDIDLVADRVWWSQALQTELGYAPHEIGPDTAWCFAHMHPDDRERVVNGMKAAAAGTDSVWRDEFRYQRADGTYAHIADRGFITRDATGRALRMTGAMQNITARNRAEATLRNSEERHAFLLKLSDELRPLRDAAELRAQACRLLGERLSASRVYYVEYYPAEGYGVVADDYLLPGLPSLAGRYPFEAFRSTYERIGSGQTWVVPDVAADQELPEPERAYYATQGVVAWLNVPLAKDDVLEATLCVVETVPRAWTALEIALAEETAERLWAAIQRGRVEAELRASEARFAQFAASSSDALWIMDAATLTTEYVSPAIQMIYGVEPETILGDVKRWASLIVPDDREPALQYLEKASGGEAVMHEFRIQRPSDGTFRWIRNTNFPLRDDQGRVQRIGGITKDVTEAKLLTEHQGILLAELQHRVRNIMALLRSITSRTGEGAEGVREYRDVLMGRLLAFARVQALLTRTANVSVDLASVVHDEVSVQAQHEGQYLLDGPDVALSPKAAEVLTLAIHELATNAVKYGALSTPGGKVTVRWSTFEQGGGAWLTFSWSEEGAPTHPTPAPGTPRRRGFGSELIEGRIPYELKGRGQVTIEPGGARCYLEFPLQERASILQTNAPQRATVFGGAIDMTGEPDLMGRRILVVEDDYYLATDTARALRGAGAEVLGPCATEEDARAELAARRPDAAIVDINLGSGSSFKLAEALKDRNIPFVFTTGYDAGVIPAEFNRVERLEKPFQLRQIVGAVVKLTMAA